MSPFAIVLALIFGVHGHHASADDWSDYPATGFLSWLNSKRPDFNVFRPYHAVMTSSHACF
jgi:hypothetical protein